jgi:hypothetical protein
MNEYDIIMWLAFLAFTVWVLWLTFHELPDQTVGEPEHDGKRYRKPPSKRL